MRVFRMLHNINFADCIVININTNMPTICIIYITKRIHYNTIGRITMDKVSNIIIVIRGHGCRGTLLLFYKYNYMFIPVGISDFKYLI